MADVFLSYKREDRPHCAAIHDALVALGLSTWFDARLELGVRFDKEIEREIHNAAVVLVLWSPQSADSDWVREEALVGRDRNCLVSARIAPCQLPMGFKGVQTADIFGSDLNGANGDWLQMLERIGKIVGRPGLAEFVRCQHAGDTECWQAWLIKYRDDPLMPKAVELLADSAGPDLRKRLAEENARRIMLEGEIEEYRATHAGQSNVLKESAAELAMLRREQAQLGDERTEIAAERESRADVPDEDAIAARVERAQAGDDGGTPPVPAAFHPPDRPGGGWFVMIGAGLLIVAIALIVVIIMLSRSGDRVAQSDPPRDGAGAENAQAAPARGVPEPEAPSAPPRGARSNGFAYQPVPTPDEAGAQASSQPPDLMDPGWSDVARDPRGNVYAIRRGDQGNTSSSRRSIWVRGDHQADQAIMHRYSMTLWQFDCDHRTYALADRINYHADGSVDRRPLGNPPVSPSVIAALSGAACR